MNGFRLISPTNQMLQQLASQITLRSLTSCPWRLDDYCLPHHILNTGETWLACLRCLARGWQGFRSRRRGGYRGECESRHRSLQPSSRPRRLAEQPSPQGAYANQQEAIHWRFLLQFIVPTLYIIRARFKKFLVALFRLDVPHRDEPLRLESRARGSCWVRVARRSRL